MKRILIALMLGFMLTVVSCGPSAQEIREKQIADSTYVADSLAKIAFDSLVVGVATPTVTTSTVK